MTDIAEPLPMSLGEYGDESGSSYSLDSLRFDYALGGIPFLSATRDQWPYTEGMAEIRKQQFDSFQEPGEQSLYGWWLRSQSTFNAGAGLLYQDPDNDNQFNYRFGDSLGIDPWTGGEISLVRDVSNEIALAGAVNRIHGYVDTTDVDSAWVLDDGDLYDINSGAIAFASTGDALDLSGAGSRSLILMTDGVWSGVDDAAPAQMFTFASPPTTGTIAYVKGRVATAIDRTLYLNPINTGAAALITASDVFEFVHPDPTWEWTSITEGPSAIYAAGRNSTQSYIYKIVVTFDAGVETFTPLITATMPTGERINTIYAYVGSFVGIATNVGFRVGELDGNGDIVYGPLLFSPAGGCQGIVGYDRFMYVGSTNAHEGASGLFKVDLGNSIQEQTTRAVRYAYARDAQAQGNAGAIQSVTMFGATDRVAFTVNGYFAEVQEATTLVASGWLTTGRIRFNTEEPKLYKFVSLRMPRTLLGNVQFSLIDESGSEIPYVTYGPSFSSGTGDVGTPQPAGRQNWIVLKFTLSRGADTATGGVLNGWQVKALPGSIRQRLISHTFLLFDEEMDKSGQRVGTDGYARERFEDFKALARAGDVVTFQELIEDTATLVVIDDWKFTQTAPPGANASTLGGYLTVVMRTVAESI